jgi:hypothetical protein
MESNTAEIPVPVRGEVIDSGQAISWYAEALNKKGEASLMALVRASLFDGLAAVTFPDIPVDAEFDVFVFEYRVPHGRVDVAIFHVDGSLTLVEAKDGRCGMKHVLCGIGQVMMYALDAGMAPSRPKVIRKALLWNSTGNLLDDAIIETACEQAGIIPMQIGPIQPQLDSAQAMLKEIKALREQEAA